MKLFAQDDVKLLVKAILALENEAECEAFLEDLLTTKELMDLSQQLMVAGYLDKALIYNEISRKTGASSATISRVNRSYAYGAGGYATVLPRLQDAIPQ